MFEIYQSYPIIIYYNETEKNLLMWAKTFWLLKTAHPLIPLQIEDNPKVKTIQAWIYNHLGENFQGLIVPVTLRPLIDIDFLIETNTKNSFASLEKNKLCICAVESLKTPFVEVPIIDVFEDLSSNLIKIETEKAFLKEKLLMNI